MRSLKLLLFSGLALAVALVALPVMVPSADILHFAKVEKFDPISTALADMGVPAKQRASDTPFAALFAVMAAPACVGLPPTGYGMKERSASVGSFKRGPVNLTFEIIDPGRTSIG